MASSLCESDLRNMAKIKSDLCSESDQKIEERINNLIKDLPPNDSLQVKLFVQFLLQQKKIINNQEPNLEQLLSFQNQIIQNPGELTSNELNQKWVNFFSPKFLHNLTIAFGKVEQLASIINFFKTQPNGNAFYHLLQQCSSESKEVPLVKPIYLNFLEENPQVPNDLQLLPDSF